MFKCHNLGGRRAVLKNAVQLHALSRFIDDNIGDLWLFLLRSFICETDERKSFVKVK